MYIKSGASQQAVSELRSLLELLSNPKEVRAALESFDKALKDLEKKEQDIAKKELAIKESAQKVEAASQEIGKISQQISLKEKDLNFKEQSFVGREQALSKNEKKLVSDISDFASLKAQAEVGLGERKQQIGKMFEEAAMAKEAGEALKDEFESKLKKLKAAGVM